MLTKTKRTGKYHIKITLKNRNKLRRTTQTRTFLCVVLLTKTLTEKS